MSAGRCYHLSVLVDMLQHFPKDADITSVFYSIGPSDARWDTPVPQARDTEQCTTLPSEEFLLHAPAYDQSRHGPNMVIF